ncbi:MAG: helix-turn-helix domain-containing protein [Armatimonadetes bacterium]|nr:helix-turn-helix domain-containing protein [Armatimonadota bacterium]
MSATTKGFDPLEYIESAFLDTKKAGKQTGSSDAAKPKRFRKTQLSAPRPRRSKQNQPAQVIDKDLKELLENLPRHMEFLGRFFSDNVTARYYQGEFGETREELIRRLVDPVLTLEDVSRLLGVCPATVRRYTNRGWLEHHRTVGGQRRFRLSGLAKFVEDHGRIPEE